MVNGRRCRTCYLFQAVPMGPLPRGNCSPSDPKPAANHSQLPLVSDARLPLPRSTAGLPQAVCGSLMFCFALPCPTLPCPQLLQARQTKESPGNLCLSCLSLVRCARLAHSLPLSLPLHHHDVRCEVDNCPSPALCREPPHGVPRTECTASIHPPIPPPKPSRLATHAAVNPRPLHHRTPVRLQLILLCPSLSLFLAHPRSRHPETLSAQSSQVDNDIANAAQLIPSTGTYIISIARVALYCYYTLYLPHPPSTIQLAIGLLI